MQLLPISLRSLRGARDHRVVQTRRLILAGAVWERLPVGHATEEVHERSAKNRGMTAR